MRSARTLIVSALLLLAALTAGLVLLLVLLPWEEYQARLRDSLNARLPVRIEFDRIHVLFKGGPGIAIEPVRLLQKDGPPEEAGFLAADRLTLRAGRIDLQNRRVSVRLHLDAPAVRLQSLVPRTSVGPPTQAGEERPSKATSLGELAPLPGGFSLAEVALAVQEGSVEFGPGGKQTAGRSPFRAEAIQASLSLAHDLSFKVGLAGCRLLWIRPGSGRAGLSARVSAEIRGHAGDWSRSWAEARLQVRDFAVQPGDRAAGPTGPVNAAFRLEGAPGPAVSVSGISITGPGTDLRAGAAEIGLGPAPPRILLTDLDLDLEEDSPAWRLLRPRVPLAGRLNLHADRIALDPTRALLPGLPKDSFRPVPAQGITSEGLRILLSGLHLPSPERFGPVLELRGGELLVEQKDRDWTGSVTLAGLRAEAGWAPGPGPGPGNEGPPGDQVPPGREKGAGPEQEPAGGQPLAQPDRAPTGTDPTGSSRPPGLRLTGPVSIKWKWSEPEGGKESRLVLVLDLTGAGIALGKWLDKPRDVPMQVGLRARALEDQVRIGRAFLQLAGMEWNLRAEATDPTDPFIKAELATGVLALEDIGRLCPLARDRDLAGRVEIKDLNLVGRLNRFVESATVRVRAAGKDLEVQGASIKGVYVQALYGDQKLTVRPVVIQPSQGMIEAELTADLAPPAPRAQAGPGRHAYYGTVKINNVEIDALVRIVAPGLAGRAHGTADVNMAFRGSGFSWPEASANLEARARVYLSRLRIEDEEDRGPDHGPPGRGLGTRLDRMARELQAARSPRAATSAGGAGRPPDLPSENRAAGSFTVRDGTLSTRNLVAVYDGKLVEVQGSLDVSGHLRIDRGNLILGRSVLPFRLDCHLGQQEPCKPRLDVKELGKNAAAEVAKSIRTLSREAAGVFRDLLL